MVKPSPLDNRNTATIAWGRYRRLMLGMALVSTLAVIAALLYLHFSLPHGLTIHMIIATTAGVGLSVMLGAALMGLVFLSNGTGHDESVDNQMPSRDELWSPRED